MAFTTIPLLESFMLIIVMVMDDIMGMAEEMDQEEGMSLVNNIVHSITLRLRGQTENFVSCYSSSRSDLLYGDGFGDNEGGDSNWLRIGNGYGDSDYGYGNGKGDGGGDAMYG